VESLSKKDAFIYDYGLFGIFLGWALAQDFRKVYLFKPWMSPFPLPHDQWVGKNMPGIITVDSYEDTKRLIMENKGLFVFPDVGDGDKQLELRKAGCNVFGAGESGELEFNRTLFKNTLKQRGLAVPKYGIVTGINDLFDLCKKEEDLWIKLDVENRGILETKHHENFKTSIQWLDKLAHDLGWMRDITKFMWEKPVGKVEGGSDQFVSKGVILEKSMLGWEDKGDGYIAKVLDTDKMPAPIKRVNEAMAPIEKKYNTCGATSSEVRTGEPGREKEPFFIDACRRLGNPPGASIVKNCKNISRVMWEISQGNMVKPEYRKQYVAELPIDHPDADKETIPFEITEKEMDNIKLRNVCFVKEKNQFYSIPFKWSTTIAKAVGIGDTLEEAEFNALDAAEKFKCTGKTFNKQTFDTLGEIIDEAKKYGWGKF
jgi:hypothetical protein